jgi:hypothetical protein
MLVPSFSLAPKLASVFSGRPSRVREQSDLDALLARMRQRQYRETMPVLASYWLKTVYAGGHKFGWWKDLNRQLKRALRESSLDAPAREGLHDIQTWIQQSVIRTGKAPEPQPPRLHPFRANLTPERLAPYITRLLNEWLPAEVARLLTDESDLANSQESGIPVLAVGRALERLLIRENLSPGTLEMLLQPEFLSPQYVYPADWEILRDVVLARLGRTRAPEPPVTPAAILAVAPGSPLPADYKDAVCNASFVSSRGCEELQVPIRAAQALEILKGDPVRIGSILVTMDGRWWESEKLQSGEQHLLVYRPGGRLRIDYSADHARLTVPWPEPELHWPGTVHFRDSLEIFGRGWQTTSWETDGERTWLRLEFSRALVAEVPAPAEVRFRRTRPASIDIAWAALETALAASLYEKSSQPIEQLRHSDLIPLGRAILALAESGKSRWHLKRETIETQLKAIRYFQTEIPSLHGRVPWRILPASLRENLVKMRPDPALAELLSQVFDDLPTFSKPIPKRPASAEGDSTSPSQAA